VQKVHEIADERGTSYRYDVEWILDTGKLPNCEREDLLYTTADAEGLTQEVRCRQKRKPVDFMQEVLMEEKAKKQRHEAEQKVAAASKKPPAAAAASKKKVSKTAAKKGASKSSNNTKSSNKPKPKATKKKAAAAKKPSTGTAAAAAASSKKRKTVEPPPPEEPVVTTTNALDMYERHRREFERFVTRVEEKVDIFRHFAEEAPPEWNEVYNQTTTPPSPPPTTTIDQASTPAAAAVAVVSSEVSTAAVASTTTTSEHAPMSANINDDVNPYPAHAPYNWQMIHRRMDRGRYVLDRRKKEEDERFELFGPYYNTLGKQRPRRRGKAASEKNDDSDDHRVLNTKGVDWELFQQDVFAMVDAALQRPVSEDEEDDEDDGQKGSLSYAAKKVKEAVQQAVERTGKRHTAEMDFSDDRHKFALAVQKDNTEAAMQSWRKVPFPERLYERLSSDVVCAGLSELDKKIATYELQTSLPDSFIGQAYRYDDTGQSEAWMKSVVDETGPSSAKKTKKKEEDEKRQAALALSADNGVTRAQVHATMQSLLISVQDKVMTENNVLHQPELRSANWFADSATHQHIKEDAETNEDSKSASEGREDPSRSAELAPEIVEQPVWGIDCYTRRNILTCLEIEFDSATSLLFIEKWLLPAINACPEDLAHNISNAARILEGLPFDDARNENGVPDEEAGSSGERRMEEWRQTLLGRALIQKIAASGPLWLQAAANQLRRARAALGPDFFRVHPKGNGSVVLSPSLKANTLVTFYRGELYPSWRWGEKMDAIEITQNRKDLKP